MDKTTTTKGEDMNTYTARYSNKAIDPSRHTVVQISAGRPRYRLTYELTEQLKILAPTRAMFKLEQGEFEQEYIRRLELLGWEDILEELRAIDERNGGKDLVLCCFEDIRVPGQWCHRTMFAKWFGPKVCYRLNELPEVTPVTTAQMKKAVPVAKPMVDEHLVGELQLIIDNTESLHNMDVAIRRKQSNYIPEGTFDHVGAQGDWLALVIEADKEMGRISQTRANDATKLDAAVRLCARFLEDVFADGLDGRLLTEKNRKRVHGMKLDSEGWKAMKAVLVPGTAV